VYVTPVTPKNFVLGRFLGALSLAVLISLAGLLGAMIGTFMPWLDQARIASFSLLPWAYVFFVVILPGTLVLCAIFFSVAALTRSFALTFAAAMIFFVADLFLNVYAMIEPGTWAALADPVARLAVAAETRFWSVAELNTDLPLGLLLQNRVLWLTVALLPWPCAALSLDLRGRRSGSTTNAWRRLRTSATVIQTITPAPTFRRDPPSCSSSRS
jgi:ABC-type transport system involved in multi-copper enzyme maturation permease subunit